MLEPLVMSQRSVLAPIHAHVRGAQQLVLSGSTYNAFAELVLMLRPGIVWDFDGAKSALDVIFLDSGSQTHLEMVEVCKEP